MWFFLIYEFLVWTSRVLDIFHLKKTWFWFGLLWNVCFFVVFFLVNRIIMAERKRKIKEKVGREFFRLLESFDIVTLKNVKNLRLYRRWNCFSDVKLPEKPSVRNLRNTFHCILVLHRLTPIPLTFSRESRHQSI